MLLLSALSSHQQKSCYLQVGELITAPENFCFGRGDGLYLPCREESCNASVSAGLDRAASPQPRCTLAPWQGLALGMQAELAGGRGNTGRGMTHAALVPRSRMPNHCFAALMLKEASKITLLWNQHPSLVQSGHSPKLSHCSCPEGKPRQAPSSSSELM